MTLATSCDAASLASITASPCTLPSFELLAPAGFVISVLNSGTVAITGLTLTSVSFAGATTVVNLAAVPSNTELVAVFDATRAANGLVGATVTLRDPAAAVLDTVSVLCDWSSTATIATGVDHGGTPSGSGGECGVLCLVNAMLQAGVAVVGIVLTVFSGIEARERECRACGTWESRGNFRPPVCLSPALVELAVARTPTPRQTTSALTQRHALTIGTLRSSHG